MDPKKESMNLSTLKPLSQDCACIVAPPRGVKTGKRRTMAVWSHYCITISSAPPVPPLTGAVQDGFQQTKYACRHVLY